jgi:hypothetical protein
VFQALAEAAYYDACTLFDYESPEPPSVLAPPDLTERLKDDEWEALAESYKTMEHLGYEPTVLLVPSDLSLSKWQEACKRWDVTVGRESLTEENWQSIQDDEATWKLAVVAGSNKPPITNVGVNGMRTRQNAPEELQPEELNQFYETMPPGLLASHTVSAAVYINLLMAKHQRKQRQIDTETRTYFDRILPPGPKESFEKSVSGISAVVEKDGSPLIQLLVGPTDEQLDSVGIRPCVFVEVKS